MDASWFLVYLSVIVSITNCNGLPFDILSEDIPRFLPCISVTVLFSEY